MATTRRRKTTRTSSRSRSDSLPARTARTVRNRPYASAALASGALAFGAAIAGAFFLSRSDKSLGETADDVRNRVKDGLAEATSKMKSLAGWDETKPQAEFAEEAMTLRQTGRKTRKPVDPMIEEQTKAGSIAY